MAFREKLSMIDALRNLGYGITTISGYGKEKEKYILFIFTSRKKRTKLIENIKKLNDNCVILSEVASSMYGGYMSS